MSYQEEEFDIFEEAAVNGLLECVDDADITVDKGQGIAMKLNSKVCGKLRQMRMSVNSFQFGSGAMGTSLATTTISAVRRTKGRKLSRDRSCRTSSGTMIYG